MLWFRLGPRNKCEHRTIASFSAEGMALPLQHHQSFTTVTMASLEMQMTIDSVKQEGLGSSLPRPWAQM